MVLGYPSMVEAADAVPALLAATDGRMIACEGLDARIVDLVRAKGNAVPELPKGAGWLFVEVHRPRPGRRGWWPRPARSSTGWCRRGPRRPRCGGSARTAPAWPR